MTFKLHPIVRYVHRAPHVDTIPHANAKVGCRTFRSSIGETLLYIKNRYLTGVLSLWLTAWKLMLS